MGSLRKLEIVSMIVEYQIGTTMQKYLLCKGASVSLPDAKENPSSYRRCKLALKLENNISFVQF